MKTKTKTPTPRPRDITNKWVRETLERMATWPGKWFAIYQIIDAMNGYDGNLSEPARSKSLTKARRKLQQSPGYTSHETPTSAQSAAVRRELRKLVEEGLVDRVAGKGRSNHSFGYHWITQADRDRSAQAIQAQEQARALARQLSLALGGDGERGVAPVIRPDDTIGVRLTLSETTSRKLLALLQEHGTFQPRAHYEIIGAATGRVIGCTWDKDDVLAEQPDATFHEIDPVDCTICGSRRE